MWLQASHSVTLCWEAEKQEGTSLENLQENSYQSILRFPEETNSPALLQGNIWDTNMRKVEDLIHMDLSSLQFMGRPVKSGWLCSLETKNMQKKPQVKAVAFEVGASAFVVCFRDNWSIPVNIEDPTVSWWHSIYKHYKRNLFCEHVADMMQSPTSPNFHCGFSNEKTLSPSLLARLDELSPPNGVPHPRHSWFCNSAEALRKGALLRGQGVPSTCYHLLNTPLNPCSCTQEKLLVLSMIRCWDNVTQAEENRWDLQTVKADHKKKASG